MATKQYQRILIVLPERLGDTLFRTPLLRLLAMIFPHAEIAALAPSKLCQAVITNNPYLNKMPAKNYDLVINVSDSKRATENIKIATAEYIEYPGDHSLKMHSADDFLSFFAKKFGFDLSGFARHYDIFPQHANFSYIEKILAKNNINLKQEIPIGFHIGCHGLAKNRSRLWRRFAHPRAWPLQKFIQLAKKIYQYNPAIRIILTGAKEEKKLGEIFSKQCQQIINLINQTSVLDLAALMTYLKLFVSNDTGAMHIACTANIKLIALFGANNPIANNPYPKSQNRIVMRKPKINDITIDEVFQELISNVCY